MELKTLLKNYRKSKQISIRKFAEMLNVSRFRMEKWETGVHPNYEDSIKIQLYFKVNDIQNIPEDFLKTFEPKKIQNNIDEVIKLKDILIEEKEKRIQDLEETIHFLMNLKDANQNKTRVSKRVSKT